MSTHDGLSGKIQAILARGIEPTGPGRWWCPDCFKDVPLSHFTKEGVPQCRRRLFWDGAKRWKVMELVDQGWRDQEIADSFGVSRQAVDSLRHRYDIPPATKAWLTPLAISRIFGYRSSVAAMHWIRRGWLTARVAHGERAFAYVVSPDDFASFLSNPVTWVAWDTNQIVDENWREYAASVRPAGATFVTIPEAARILSVSERTVRRWISSGRIAGAVRYLAWLIPVQSLEHVDVPTMGGNRKQRKAEHA